ncbi:MAG: hypothetical protein JXB38_17535 [Anaerolineales bacterium]|nr:hypothetical protein [Anaerolineales bacterium]
MSKMKTIKNLLWIFIAAICIVGCDLDFEGLETEEVILSTVSLSQQATATSDALVLPTITVTIAPSPTQQPNATEISLHLELDREFDMAGRLLEFSPDGTKIVVANEDPDPILIIDAQTGEIVQEIYKPRSEIDGLIYGIGDLAFFPDGEKLAGGGSEQKVLIWDLDSGELIQEYQKIAGITRIVISSDGNLLAYIITGDLMTDASIINFGESVCRFPLVITNYKDLAFSPTQNLIAGAVDVFSEGVNVRVWRIDDQEYCQPVLDLFSDGGYAQSIDFSPDGELIAVIVDQKVRIWDLTASQEIVWPVMDQDEKRFNKVKFSSTGQLVARDQDRNFTIYDPYTGEVLGIIEISEKGEEYYRPHFSISPDGSEIATIIPGVPLQIWRMP